MTQRMPSAADLLRRIIAAQQRRRQLFQRIEHQTKRREDEHGLSIRAMPPIIGFERG
jgi:hypothetical protein